MKIKNVFKFLFGCFVFLFVLLNVNADTSTITIGESTALDGYVANTRFSVKQESNGRFLYCVNNNLQTARNTNAKFVGENDKGIVYILRNGFPYVSFKNNDKLDYYITQSAIWWYLDSTKGTSNLSTAFKTTGADNYNLRPIIQNLVNKAISYKQQKDVEISVSSSSNSLTIDKEGKYYVSQLIKLNNAISDYSVNLEGAPNGSLIVDSNFNNKTSFSKDESFYIRIPVSAVNTSSLDIKVIATTSQSNFHAYEYQPDNASMQNVTKLYKITKKVSSSNVFTISSSYVSIIKLDKDTSSPLAGAKLSLKGHDGKVISSWTTTANAHVFKNLPNGTYTIVEDVAPSGYQLNDKVTTFTIDNEHKKFDIKIHNQLMNNVVTISKIDKETGNLLSGAVIVIKDSSGNVVQKFTSTEQSYVINNLSYGTYTIEEESAPEGYIKANEVKSFTIDKDHTSFQINIENLKQQVANVVPQQNINVPDTATSDIITIIFGLLIIFFGIGYLNREKLQKVFVRYFK